MDIENFRASISEYFCCYQNPTVSPTAVIYSSILAWQQANYHLPSHTAVLRKVPCSQLMSSISWKYLLSTGPFSQGLETSCSSLILSEGSANSGLKPFNWTAELYLLLDTLWVFLGSPPATGPTLSDVSPALTFLWCERSTTQTQCQDRPV